MSNMDATFQSTEQTFQGANPAFQPHQGFQTHPGIQNTSASMHAPRPVSAPAGDPAGSTGGGAAPFDPNPHVNLMNPQEQKGRHSNRHGNGLSYRHS